MNNTISLNQAIAMTTLYRQQKEVILADGYKGKNILSDCETFDADTFRATLDNPDVKSIRIYYGMNEDLRVRTIIVGVDANNQDMLPGSDEMTKEATTPATTPPNQIMEEGAICPPVCPPPSPLRP